MQADPTTVLDFIAGTAHWPSPFDAERIAIIRGLVGGTRIEIGVGTATMLAEVYDQGHPMWSRIDVRPVGG